MKQHNPMKLMATLAAVLMMALTMNACGGGGGGGGGGPVPPAPIPAGTAARLVTITTSMPTPTAFGAVPGTATGKLALNMDTGEVGGAILYSGLSSSTLAAGIYDSTAPGSLPVITLTGGTGNTGAWSVPAGTSLSIFQLSSLANGSYFFRLDASFTGEKQGTIVSPSITLATALPPVAGTGSAGGGNATLQVNLGTGAISGAVSYSGLTSNAVSAQIHQHSDNAAIVTLTGIGAQAGIFNVPAAAFLNAPQLKALVNNGLYIAVHSERFQDPVSELAGTITYPVRTIPAVQLTGGQEVPPPAVPVISSGTGNLTVNLGTGAISGSVIFNMQSSLATAAHVHQGFAGTNGAPIINLAGGESRTSGTWTVPANRFLTAGELGSLISDGLYLNIHSGANLNGEIRGQIRNVPAN